VPDLSEHHEPFQRMIDALYASDQRVSRLDVIVRAESMDMPQEVVDLVALIPPGSYTRQRLCDQLNSAIVGHGWGLTLGTFD
jgi:hypothetical protein